MLRGVRLDLAAIQAHVAHLEQAHRPRQLQDLYEQPLQLRQEPLAERRDRVVIRVKVCRDKTKRHRIVGRPLKLAAGEHPSGVPVEQQGHQHARRKRCNAAPGVAPLQFAQVQLVHDLNDKSRQVILRQPVLHRRRQQVQRIPVNFYESAQLHPLQ